MDYFVLSGFGYWKYYIMLLYYRLAEYPPMVRFCAVFTTFFLILFVFLLILDGVRTYRDVNHERHDRRARRRYQQAVVEMATTPPESGSRCDPGTAGYPGGLQTASPLCPSHPSDVAGYLSENQGQHQQGQLA